MVYLPTFKRVMFFVVHVGEYTSSMDPTGGYV